ncbi:UNVERIFIED_CONTAM: Kinesin-like protein KIN-7G [Sesamum latifolium]|uniref:Kinesin-like protein KIN-7G n=1 Tax=Sesamum latifolium TaxID=2727402 RepID=A0AAW2SG20_9LAMI
MEILKSGRELSKGNEERIYVSVRLRPLNDNEISRNDVSDWECINDDTIVYKNASLASERSMHPTAYTFGKEVPKMQFLDTLFGVLCSDRIFRSDCSTREVYAQGAKDVALSVVHGMNSQRQIGETSLNEMSSRSHQIIRLTIESSSHESLGRENARTLEAAVNFVDLAGSERTSQSLSAGTRLKEGCHINRSLLTLGTVIRKLSKERKGHIPYRDSKLTRILQTSLEEMPEQPLSAQ